MPFRRLLIWIPAVFMRSRNNSRLKHLLKHAPLSIGSFGWSDASPLSIPWISYDCIIKYKMAAWEAGLWFQKLFRLVCKRSFTTFSCTPRSNQLPTHETSSYTPKSIQLLPKRPLVATQSRSTPAQATPSCTPRSIQLPSQTTSSCTPRSIQLPPHVTS